MKFSSKDFGLGRSYWEIRVGSPVLNLYLWGLVTFVWSPYLWHISGTWPTFSWMMDFTCIQYFVGWMILTSLYIWAVCWISSFPFRSWWPEIRWVLQYLLGWMLRSVFFANICHGLMEEAFQNTCYYYIIYCIKTKWCWDDVEDLWFCLWWSWYYRGRTVDTFLFDIGFDVLAVDCIKIGSMKGNQQCKD